MMLSKKTTRGVLFLLCLLMAFAFSVVPSVAAGSYTPTDGITVEVSRTSSKGTVTDKEEDDGDIVVTATGSAGGFLGIGKYSCTATITITNDSGSPVLISFNWETSYVNSLKIEGVTYSGSGSYTTPAPILADGNITVTVTTSSNATVNTLTLSGFTTQAVSSSSDVTFQYDSSLGGVTVDGTAVDAGSASEISVTGATLVATPKSGSVFLGWVDTATNYRISSSATYTLKPSENMTVKAVFVTGAVTDNAWFLVNGTYMFDDLNAAAGMTGAKKVVTMNSGTLPVDDYVIPAGVQFLIPFSADDDGSFAAAPEDNYVTESEMCDYYDAGDVANFTYRTLTLTTGGTITCYGEINVNGQRQKNGQPYTGVNGGDHGRLILGQEEATFTNSDESALVPQLIIAKADGADTGGKLYCYGYITGTGMVEIRSGAEIHENLQICDWPGGSSAANWPSDSKKGKNIFVLTQYYIQNIEAPLRFSYGATGYITGVVTGSAGILGNVTKPLSTAYAGIGTGLFQLGNSADKGGMSSFTRIYDHTNDRMNYHLHGDITLGSIDIEVTAVQTIRLNSSDYILPLGTTMKLIVEDGFMTMNQKIALLPGAEVHIKEGASVSGSGECYMISSAAWTNSHFFDRGGMSLNENETMGRTAPKYAPLPYIATRNGLGPNVTQIARGYTENTQRYYTDVTSNPSDCKLIVDGMMEIKDGGALCATYTKTSTTSSTATVKGMSSGLGVTGSGVIKFAGTNKEGTLNAGDSTSYNFLTTYAKGKLAGLASEVGTSAADAQKTERSFIRGTYYGLGTDHGLGSTTYDNYWYNYTVSVPEGSESGFTGTTSAPKLWLNYVTITEGEKTTENVVGLVANSGVFDFGYDGTTLSMSSTGKIPAMALSETGYTLSKFNGDVTLGTGGENSTTVGFVASNAKPAMIKNLSVVFPAGSDLSNYYSDSMLGTPASSGNVGYTVYTDGGEAVAAIGPSEGNYAYAFAKVSDAVSTATGGNTYVTVLKDRSLTDPITVASGQNITLDLGGKTLDGGSDKAKEPLTNNGILRLINGTITYKAAYRTGSDGKGDMSQELMTATVRNNGTIEYIDNVTLKEMYSSASVYVTPLMNCTGATIKEIRSGSFVGTSMSNGGVGIMNFGTINTIGANEEEITFYNRRGIVCAKGTISTIGGAGSTIKITHGQRGIETLAAGTITTIGVDRSKIEIINDASHKMVKSGIYSAGTIGTIGGKGSSIDISINVTATHIYANYGINIASGSVGVIGDSKSVITITGTTAQNLDTAYSIYGLWNYKGTITTLGTTGSQIYVNVSHTGNGDAYGIMNQKTVETLGASGSVIEVVSNKYGIYNSGSISSLGGDLVAVSTDTTGSYYALYNAGTITSINSGDYYHASGRANAVYNPDSQKYPAGYDLSTTTRNVALVDGSHYPCYYLAKSGAGIITSEEPGGAPATPENQGILGDIIADYLELSESERNDSYIVLTQNCDEPTSITLTGDVYLDLNGHSADLTGFELGKYNLYVIDSATNAYLTNDGDKAGYIVGFDGASAVHTSDRGASKGKHYVQVEGENGIEFHRAAVSVTTIQYTPGQDYAVFQGVFRGTSDVVTALKDVGFRFNEETDVWYNMTDKNATAIYDMPFSYACKLEGVDSVQALLSFAEEPTAASMIVSTLRAGIADLIKGASE